MKDEYRPFHGILPGNSLYIVAGLCLTILIVGITLVSTGYFE